MWSLFTSLQYMAVKMLHPLSELSCANEFSLLYPTCVVRRKSKRRSRMPMSKAHTSNECITTSMRAPAKTLAKVAAQGWLRTTSLSQSIKSSVDACQIKCYVASTEVKPIWSYRTALKSWKDLIQPCLPFPQLCEERCNNLDRLTEWPLEVHNLYCH